MTTRRSIDMLCIALCAGAMALGAGCGSMYHELARERAAESDDRLGTRSAEAVRMHREAAATLGRVAPTFEDRWLLERPLAHWRRLEEIRFLASGRVWEARKRTASIGDVLADPLVESTPEARAGARRLMASLEAAGERLDESLDALSHIVDTWKGEMTADEFDPASVSRPLDEARRVLAALAEPSPTGSAINVSAD